MRRVRCAFGVLLVALALVVWFAFAPSPEEAVTSRRSASTESGPRVDRSPTSVPPTTSVQRSEPPRPPSEPAAPEPTSGVRRLTLLDARTDAPLVGVEVAIRPHRLGPVAPTDERGTTELPSTTRYCALDFETELEPATVQLPPGDKDLTVELEPAARVRFVRADGGPARPLPLLVGPVDDDSPGAARLVTPRAGEEWTRLRAGPSDELGPRVRVSRPPWIGPVEWVEVEVEAARSAPPELSAVDVAELDVVLVDQLGAPFDGTAHVVVETREEADRGYPLGRRPVLRRLWEPSSVRLGPLGAGLELRLRVEPAEELVPVRVTVEPLEPGERRTVRLVVPPRPVVTGVVRDSIVRPVVGWTVEVESWSATGRSDDDAYSRWYDWVDTDSNGRFTVRPPVPAEHLAGMDVRLTLQHPDQSGEVGPALYVGPVPEVDTRGIFDFGEIEANDVDAAVRGRVTDVQGRPLGRIRVDARSHEGSWSVVTDADGRFHVRTSGTSEAELGFSGRSNEEIGWYAEAPVIAREGEFTHVVLKPAGGLSGRVVGLRDGEASRLRIDVDGHVVPPTHEGWYPGIEWLSVGARRDGSFSISGLAPGVARLRIVWTDLATELAEFHDVRVVSGRVTADPRLQSLNLTETTDWCEVEIVGPDGEPVRASVFVGTPSGAWSYRTIEVERGRVRVMRSSGGGVRLAVHADGYLGRTVSTADPRLRVELARAPERGLGVACAPGWVDRPDGDDWALWVDLEWLGGGTASDEFAPGFGAGGTLSAGDELELAASVPGRFRLSQWLSRDGDEVELEELAMEVELTLDRPRREVVLPFDAAVWRRALERLRVGAGSGK